MKFQNEKGEEYRLKDDVFSHRIITIFGEPGTGKSVLLDELLFDLVDMQKKELTIAILDSKGVVFSLKRYPFARIAKTEIEIDSLLEEIESNPSKSWILLVDEFYALKNRQKDKIETLSKQSDLKMVIASQLKTEKRFGKNNDSILELSVDDKHVVKKEEFKMSKVLVNKCFSGDYNNDKNNIGHEFINFFPSDDGSWNFYVTPYGTINKDYDELDYLLMVQYVGGEHVLLGIAEGLKSTGVFSKTSVKKIQHERGENGKICYFGKSLGDWFKYQKNTLFVTYKMKKDGKVFFPKKRVIVKLVDDKNDSNTIYLPKLNRNETKDRKKVAGQSMKGYFDVDNFGKTIDSLLNSGLIEEYSAKNSSSNSSFKPKTLDKSVLDMIGHPNDEVIISKWLGSCLEENLFFDYFLEKCCGLDSSKSKERMVCLEKSTEDRNRVDFWLQFDNHVVLIENKVQSQIHESKSNGKPVSQLDAYYSFGEKKLKDLSSSKKKLDCFLMCPDYYSSYFGISPLWNKNTWVEIKYSKLKECIDDFAKNNQKISEKYRMEEFSKSLAVHCNNTPLSMKDVILDRVNQRIQQP